MKRYPSWRERYFRDCIKDYATHINTDRIEQSAEEKVYNLMRTIKSDFDRAQFPVRMSRTNMMMNLKYLLGCEIITIDDLDGFSTQLIDTLQAFLEEF